MLKYIINILEACIFSATFIIILKIHPSKWWNKYLNRHDKNMVFSSDKLTKKALLFKHTGIILALDKII